MEIIVRELTKSYPTPTEPLVVLEELSFELESGGALAVTGPSGSGKSTLLQILGTLDGPTGGSLTLGGRDPSRMAAQELAAFRNQEVGFVFQDHFLLPQLSVLENVLVPTIVWRARGAQAEAFRGREERARSLLDRVGLAARLEHRPSELSGGERQRAALARALIAKPGLVLADEPTGNLDQDNADRIADLLFELREREGYTLVVVTHSGELAARFPRRLDLRAAGAAPAAGRAAAEGSAGS